MKMMIEVIKHDILKILHSSYHVSLIYDVIRDVILLFWLILATNRCFI